MPKVDIDGDGKPDFSITLPNIAMILGGIISLVSSYYMLDSKIEKAMQEPEQEVVQKDIDGLRVEMDLRLDKLEKQVEDEKERLKDLETELRTQYKRR
jgi:flagellar capping protein FliD